MTALTLFNVAQTFWVKANQVAGSPTVELAGVDIFFKHMPDPVNNISGILRPGVTLYLAETIFGVPKITANTYQNYARLEYNQIQTSSDASAASRFVFANPPTVATDAEYAILLSYDGNENFVPWTAENGWWEVGFARNIFTASNPSIGSYFEYASQDLANDPTQAQTQAQYLSFWNPLKGYQMTFDVFVSRYFIDGIPVSDPSANVPTGSVVYQASFITKWNANTGVYQYVFPDPNMEGIEFTNSLSIFNTEIGAQQVYQNTVPFGGLANPVRISTNSQSNVITANTTMPNGTAFNWNNVFNNYAGPCFIVANNAGNISIYSVKSIISNTQIQIASNAQFTNANTTFFISPIAWVDSTLSGLSPQGKLNSFLFLINSNANSSVRFVNSSILSATTGANGTGYNNTDVITFSGYEFVAGKVTGGYVATANLTTNSTGGLTAVLMSNLGCSFTNTANITATIANSSGGSSNGSGAGTWTYNIGAVLNTIYNNNIFANCTVMNIDIDDVQPFFSVKNPIGTTYSMDFSSLYYIQNDTGTSSGFVTYAGVTPQDFTINMLADNPLVTNTAVAFVSRSNEFGICYANGANAGLANSLNLYSNTFLVNLDTTSNNDYRAVIVLTQPTIEMGKFIINNDYTGEETNNGNAYAKHLSTIVNYQGLAEDLRVYLAVYKPAFTDIECYARIQNSPADVQSFNTEQWTRLHLVDGSSNAQLSSTSDANDYVQLTFGFQPYPNTFATLVGTATSTNNSFTLTGLGTSWQTNANTQLQLAAGSMIKIYNALFPANYMVTTVNSVASNTSITINDNINSNTSLNGNPNLVGSGLQVDLITYTHQGFNNALNDNVVRYYNSSLIKWDGFNNLQLKVILLSSKLSYIPRLHTIQSTGVSA